MTDAASLLQTASMTDPAISAHPREYYAAMRQLDPVHWDEKLGMYLISPATPTSRRCRQTRSPSR